MHARGAGAHGMFRLHTSLDRYTKAGLFTDTKATTEVFVRFSTVNGSRGSADTARDARGFATKFYTSEGVWDLVGNNIPVFFIQEPGIVIGANAGAIADSFVTSIAKDRHWSRTGTERVSA